MNLFSYFKIYFSINHPAPKHINPPNKSFGSINLGNLIINPTAIINIPNNSKHFAA